MIYDQNNNHNTAIVCLSFLFFFIRLYAFHGTSANISHILIICLAAAALARIIF